MRTDCSSKVKMTGIDIAVSFLRFVNLAPSAKMVGEDVRVGGLAERNQRIFRCPASPTHNRRLARGWCFATPFTHSQQKKPLEERSAAMRLSVRAAKPAPAIAADTGSIPETEARVKNKAPARK